LNLQSSTVPTGQEDFSRGFQATVREQLVEKVGVNPQEMLFIPKDKVNRNFRSPVISIVQGIRLQTTKAFFSFVAHSTAEDFLRFSGLKATAKVCQRLSQKSPENGIPDPCRFIRRVKQIGSQHRYEDSKDPCWLVQQVNEFLRWCVSICRANSFTVRTRRDGVVMRKKTFQVQRGQKKEPYYSL
jgi:hypothetical protein